MAVVHSLYRESGTVTVDEASCTVCGQCARICPVDYLAVEDGRLRIDSANPLGCITCGHCMMVCPGDSIRVSGRGMTPDALMDLPERSARTDASALGALMQSRRSVRRFSDKPVQRGALAEIVAMASTAPMAVPPWDIGCVVVEGGEKVRDLAFDVVAGYERMLKLFRPWVLKLLRPVLGKATYEQFAHCIRPLGEMIVANGRQGRDTVFWGAPAVIVFHHSPYADHADVAIAVTYAMLAAESFGLGSTIIGCAGPVIQRSKALRRRLQIPDGHHVAHALILGHPATTFRKGIARSFLSTRFI